MLCTYILFIVNWVKILLATAEFFCHVAKNGSVVVALGENVVSQQIHVSPVQTKCPKSGLYIQKLISIIDASSIINCLK